MPDDHTVRATLQFLQQLREAGITDLPAGGLPQSGPRESATRGETATLETPPEVPASATEPDMASPSPTANPSSKAPIDGQNLTEAQRTTALKQLQERVAQCTACAELARERTQTVFGVGPPRPRVCFLGEGPGADEDRQGEPFVGRAGQLLNKIIEACGWRRDDVFILNTVKCRPPGNRNPSDSELANCRGFLDAQLAILQPPFICCLGAVAARALLGTTESIGRLRQRFHSYGAASVVVTYHPAYLLRNPAAKGKTWEDMQMLMARVDPAPE